MAQLEGFPFPREKTIGILGGGQFARMLAASAGRLGFSTIILDPANNCPAAQFSNAQIIAEYDDDNALDELAEHCSVVTYEFENVPVSSAKILEKSCKVYPRPNALEISQDRLVEKQFIQSAGLKTTACLPVSANKDLKNAILSLGLPAILKSRRLGYDGKGQLLLDKTNSAAMADQIDKILEVDCILEALVEFECEISVIGARDNDGHTACYDPARNSHKNGILLTSSVPCNLPDKITDTARQQTNVLMEKLDYVGVIGVEFFVTRSGNLLINEFAPRVHNSGHWTEAACAISQFEQHIRAITGLTLGSTIAHAECRMENLIGEEITNIGELAQKPDVLIHDYGKQQIRPGRKMGHFTTLYSKPR